MLADALRYIEQNPLTLFNSLLLIGTGWLSYSSYKFQSRAGVREALDQLEDIDIYRGKLSPILDEFTFKPLSGEFSSTVKLKYYKYGRNPASANKEDSLLSRTLYLLNDKAASENITEEEFYRLLSESLEELPTVDAVAVNTNGIFLQFETVNAVQVRRRTEFVLEQIVEAHTADVDTLKENLRAMRED